MTSDQEPSPVQRAALDFHRNAFSLEAPPVDVLDLFDEYRADPAPCCLHCLTPLRDHSPAELRACAEEVGDA